MALIRFGSISELVEEALRECSCHVVQNRSESSLFFDYQDELYCLMQEVRPSRRPNLFDQLLVLYHARMDSIYLNKWGGTEKTHLLFTFRSKSRGVKFADSTANPAGQRRIKEFIIGCLKNPNFIREHPGSHKEKVK